ARRIAHRRLAVGLYRPPAGDPRGVGAQRRRHADVHLRGFRGDVDCRPHRAGLRHRPRHRNARRCDHGHRSESRAGPEQHHGLHWLNRGQSGRRRYAPDPQQLVYAVLLALSAAEALILWYMPETVTPKPGALASLRPHVSIPAKARRALMQVTPVTIASWALGGFYFSLMPSLVRVATGVTLPIVGGLVVSALTFTGAMAVQSFRNTSARRILSGGIPALVAGVAVTLAGVQVQRV